MNRFSITLLTAVAVVSSFLFQVPVARPEHTTAPAEEPKKRKFFEYKGNYREEIEQARKKFLDAFGYELVDSDKGWKKDEIEKLHRVFSKLPESFHRLPGLKGLIRVYAFPSRFQEGQGGRIPAATFPKFTTIYREEFKSHLAVFSDDIFRLELYDPLFNEEDADFENIVHHEMGHAADISHGMLSFTPEWLQISGFSILNLPALDARPDADYIYALRNDPANTGYAPVSVRHLPTYSRENPQEDFANSVAAYIHYPYFRYSHPARYQYLMDKVFGGKEYFPADSGPSGYHERVLADARGYVEGKQWEALFKLVTEVSRNPDMKLEAALLPLLYKAVEPANGEDSVPWVVKATCYMNDPGALILRRQMATVKRVSVSEMMKHERCFRVGRKAFEEDQAKWPPLNLYFFLDDNKPYVQLMDPIALNAHARGFKTRYLWTLNFPESTGKVVLNGSAEGPEVVTGAVMIDMNKSAFRLFELPEGAKLTMDVKVERYNDRGDKFESTPSRIQFVVHPWFPYTTQKSDIVKVRYPASMMQLERRGP